MGLLVASIQIITNPLIVAPGSRTMYGRLLSQANHQTPLFVTIQIFLDWLTMGPSIPSGLSIVMVVVRVVCEESHQSTEDGPDQPPEPLHRMGSINGVTHQFVG